ncbi:MAG: type II toxin-antitoxin system HicA family toxin [Chitinispirillia bacterium]|nr:type II toxin-antitoxin system HicA family toxin [Chitinispirillia bacterium]MCL2241317.1 type II toxin-antitoxin system HicA family toxin [Chitinispirillia bacterium]
MSRKDQLLARLKSMPKDFTFDELKTLLGLLGFILVEAGKTSGSRVTFKLGEKVIMLHKPHPRKEILVQYLKRIEEDLRKGGLI